MAKKLTVQRKTWYTARNKRRRERYQADPQYRRSINRKNRDNYREEVGAVLRSPGGKADLQRAGENRKVKVNGVEKIRKTYSIAEMAEALGGYHKIVIYRWIRSGRFPAPTEEVHETGKPPFRVYSGSEAASLVQVFSEHQKEKAYFYKSDTETIEKLFAAVGQKIATISN